MLVICAVGLFLFAASVCSVAMCWRWREAPPAERYDPYAWHRRQIERIREDQRRREGGIRTKH